VNVVVLFLEHTVGHCLNPQSGEKNCSASYCIRWWGQCSAGAKRGCGQVARPGTLGRVLSNPHMITSFYPTTGTGMEAEYEVGAPVSSYSLICIY
jgi:hypothetical protein